MIGMLLYWSAFGLLGCGAIVIISKLLGKKILQRPEDWYDKPAEARDLTLVGFFVLLFGAVGYAALRLVGADLGVHVAQPTTSLPASGAFPPALLLIAGALVAAIVPRRVRAMTCVAAPALTLVYVLGGLSVGDGATFPFAGFVLEVVRADRLSILFGAIFSLVGVIGGIYAWHNDDRRQQVASQLYAAGALGVTFAGDYLTLYAFWELMAIASVFLIWTADRPDAEASGWRYLLFHLAGGAVLLGGVLLRVVETGSIRFTAIDPADAALSSWLILIGVCLNAAVPPLGPWLPDSYPRATITGAIFCSALTTKTAVYVLLRGFAGWHVLIAVGVCMALYGVVYAVLANDIRELLAYHIISQVGYMVAGAGMGSELAINGAAAHAVCHILYKSVLFMGAGIVIDTTGRNKLTELGGYWKRQRLVFGLYMIGAFSISGFPLFNGFVSKSMVTAAAHEAHITWAFQLLMLASVGTFLHTGLKLPFGVWLGVDKGIEPKPARANMVMALGIGAFLCTLFGVLPGLLYRYLPYPVEWHPFTAEHFEEMVPLLIFTYVAFKLLEKMLAPEAKLSVDTDALYRKAAPAARAVFLTSTAKLFAAVESVAIIVKDKVVAFLLDPTQYLPGALAPVASDEPGYDEDRNRRPLGVTLTLTFVTFVVLAILTFASRTV